MSWSTNSKLRRTLLNTCRKSFVIESLRVVRKAMDSVAAALAFRALGYVCGGGTKPKPKRRRWAASLAIRW
jgi:hypothetical protein